MRDSTCGSACTRLVAPTSMPPNLPALLAASLSEVEAVARAAGYSPHYARVARREVLSGRPKPRAEAVPARLAEALGEAFAWRSSTVERAADDDDGAQKRLVRLSDGEVVEAVRLPGTGTPSACLSTQVGCAMACRFCASGLDKVRRNLGAHELLEQVSHLRELGPVRRAVFMGSGEPTQNLTALAAAMDVLRDEAELGPRHLLVSTVGPPSAVDRLTALGRRFTLALSLHAADAATRASLIPTQARVVPEELLAAADRYWEATGRAYQVEVVLLGGLTDTPEAISALVDLLSPRRARAHVSLIAWNPVPGMAFARPDAAAVASALSALRAHGISARLRATVGGAADAACGQLRARVLADGAR
ncbi:MAG: radical SAM protein [Myxococcales bacterium]|nr:radical SAM protein [Myxococcales bacterium]